jgi:hypothetical protein
MGCHMSRDAEAELARAGFVARETVGFQVFAAGLPAFPMRRITAGIAAPSSPRA